MYDQLNLASESSLFASLSDFRLEFQITWNAPNISAIDVVVADFLIS